MTDNEVNKIIAEFMGVTLMTWSNGNLSIPNYSGQSPPYTESLDALVSVWEKLKLSDIVDFGVLITETHVGVNWVKKKFEHDEYRPVDAFYGVIKDGSIQQAAAHATAKAIKGLL